MALFPLLALVLLLAAITTPTLALGPNPALSVIEVYKQAVLTHPLRTNMVTASVLSVFSDAVTQKIERNQASKAQAQASQAQAQAQIQTQTQTQIEALAQAQTSQAVDVVSTSTSTSTRPKHSYYRSATMAVYGAFVSGAFVMKWFEVLNKIVPPPMTLPRVLWKVFVNQVCMSPTLNSVFFTWVVFTRDLVSSFKEKSKMLSTKLKKDLAPTIFRSCIYWSIGNILNFSLIQQEYQVIYTNFLFLIWTAYLSFVGFKK